MTMMRSPGAQQKLAMGNQHVTLAKNRYDLQVILAIRPEAPC